MLTNSLNQYKVCQDYPKFEICGPETIPIYIISDWLTSLSPLPLFNKCYQAQGLFLGNEDILVNKADRGQDSSESKSSKGTQETSKNFNNELYMVISRTHRILE